MNRCFNTPCHINAKDFEQLNESERQHPEIYRQAEVRKIYPDLTRTQSMAMQMFGFNEMLRLKQEQAHKSQ